MTERSASPESTPRRHRRGLTRSAAACERCRRRKQKCDGRVPCGACAATRTTCVPSTRLAQSHECECESLRSRLQIAEQQYAALLRDHENLQISAQGVAHAESLPQSVPATGSQSVPCDMGIPQIPQAKMNHHPLHRILRPSFPRRTSGGKAYSSAMSSAWKLWGDDPDTAAFCDMESFTEPDDTTYVSLVNTFFDRRWTYLPVLHRPSFVSEHLTPFLARSPTKVTSNFLVNIVCAIAATDKAWAQQWDLQRHKQFFKRAIQDVYVLSSVEDFECMQCFLLLCMYGHNEPQSVNMWYTSGITLQMAIDLDLHRKESVSGQSLLRAELSKRVFWSAYVTHCSMAINMGRPLAIQESDITVPLPLQLRDEQLTDSFDVPDVNELAVPQLMDTSTFNHIIKLRLTNAAVYKTFHSIRCGPMGSVELDTTRQAYYLSLNQWLISAPRYIGAVSTYQSTEWFQIAFHHAVLSLYRPSRAAPMPSSDDLRICTESAIGLITSYSSLYARNRIKYTFVAIHSLFLAAVTMLYALRASQQLRQELTKPVVETNILTFLTLFRGISDGRTIGEKCSGIVERLANSLLTLFDVGPIPDADLDVEFQSWFGLQTHAVVTPARNEELAGEFPDVRVDLPWADLFTEGFDMGAADLWSYSFLE